MHWPLVYLPGERLSAAELSAARLDGHLIEVGEGYMPADAVEGAAARAASLRSVCGTRLVACSWSAAWVYGSLIHPPARHEVMRGAARRVGNPIDRRAIFHDVGVVDDDVTEIAGVLVTTPLRTLIDVARRIREPEHRQSASAVVGALIDTGLANPFDALARVDASPRLPGTPAARREIRRHLGADRLRA